MNAPTVHESARHAAAPISARASARARPQMPPPTPDVDFTSEEEYRDLLDLALLTAKAPVLDIIRKRVTGWGMWPHHVTIPMHPEARAAFQIVTRHAPAAREWALACAEELHGVAQACTAAVTQYTRLTDADTDAERLTECVRDQIDAMLRKAARRLFEHNTVLIEPVVPFVAGMRYRFTWPQVYDHRRAVAMGLHARLGEGSPLAWLSEDLVRHILEVAIHGTTRLDTRDRPPAREISDALWQMQLTA